MRPPLVADRLVRAASSSPIPVPLAVGLSIDRHLVVPPEWIAHRMGNLGVDVFATPSIVDWLDVLGAVEVPGAATFSAWPIAAHGAGAVKIVWMIRGG